MDYFSRPSVSAFQREAEEFEARKRDRELARQESMAKIQNLRQGGENPSAVREWQYYSNLPQNQQQEYLRMKRADQVMNLGGMMGVRNPLGGGLIEEYEVTPKPEQMPDFQAAQREATRGVDLHYDPMIAGQAEAARLQQQLQYKPQIEADIDTQKKLLEKDFLRPKAEAAKNAAGARIQRMARDIARAKGMISPWTTGTIRSSILQQIPGTPATNMGAILDTVRANIGFDELNAMRQFSPTGGALGNVTERELAFLQNVLVNLEQSQSPEQLLENLEIAEKEIADSWARISQAYEADFGGQDPMAANQAAAAQRAEEMGEANPYATVPPPQLDPRNIPMGAVRELKADPSPQAMQEFDEVFGAGAAKMVIGNGK